MSGVSVRWKRIAPQVQRPFMASSGWVGDSMPRAAAIFQRDGPRPGLARAPGPRVGALPPSLARLPREYLRPEEAPGAWSGRRARAVVVGQDHSEKVMRPSV
ncbi:hypothetical protein GCM10011326_18040 [Salipiger profundus]|nr:hypothetical protein GCM10011326_18040 [Salipiger profundus]